MMEWVPVLANDTAQLSCARSSLPLFPLALSTHLSFQQLLPPSSYTIILSLLRRLHASLFLLFKQSSRTLLCRNTRYSTPRASSRIKRSCSLLLLREAQVVQLRIGDLSSYPLTAQRPCEITGNRNDILRKLVLRRMFIE